ncbi:hypothetical protein Cspa_c29500 [Clostridium saccharoperbutylacetonicum N1-4(HMT)]|uniref:Uncharacterized protein n=2 Tax=Clostridium saccharoperbutylacetonicum TaxID=36745 RepID=M1MPQ9_9CLOT|nr:hypothetical protein Cspa_c29500 [Clostridium saccharoperbutylacetonicum N1-4(HMT)]
MLFNDVFIGNCKYKWGKYMRVLCKRCGLNCHLDEYKERLDSIMVKKNYNLLNDEVISLSEFLDDLVYNCVYCEEDRPYLKGKVSNENLYYYGNNHLFINLYLYIMDEIRNKKIIYICTEQNVYERLIEILLINRVAIDNVKFKSLQEVTLENKDLKHVNLEKEVRDFFHHDDKKYNGISWIVDPLYIRNSTTQKNYFDLNNKIHEYIKNINLNILFIYDAYESMHRMKMAIPGEMEKYLKFLSDKSFSVERVSGRII